MTKRFEPSDYIIGIWGDSPLITSGFGTANKMLADHLIAMGYTVYFLGSMDYVPDFKSPYHVWPAHETDPLHEKSIVKFINTVKPDLMIIHQDPGMLAERLTKLGLFGNGCPTVAWFPIEGEPLHPRFYDVPRYANRSFCYTQFGVDQLRAEVPEPTHIAKQTLGYDHAPFRPFSRETREHLKHVCGLDGYFLVGNVAVNKRGNRHHALIEASCMTAAKGLPILWYLHTDGSENQGLQGPNLEVIRKQYNADHCWLKGDGKTAYDGVRYDDNTTEEEYLALVRPETGEEQQALFNRLSLIAKYNMMDLYIDPSSVQGYNLPTVEAAACGVPIISVNDGAARSELFPDLALEMMIPEAWDVWHTTARLGLVSPDQIAYIAAEMYAYSVKEDENYQGDREYTAAVAREYFQWDLTPIANAVEDLLSQPREALQPMRTLRFGTTFQPLQTTLPARTAPAEAPENPAPEAVPESPVSGEVESTESSPPEDNLTLLDETSFDTYQLTTETGETEWVLVFPGTQERTESESEPMLPTGTTTSHPSEPSTSAKPGSWNGGGLTIVGDDSPELVYLPESPTNPEKNT